MEKFWRGFNLAHSGFEIFGADLIWRSKDFFLFGADLIWRSKEIFEFGANLIWRIRKFFRPSPVVPVVDKADKKKNNGNIITID